MRINYKDIQALTLLTEAGYASTEKRMKSFCESNGIRPSKLLKEIGEGTVKYWANYWRK